MVLWEWLRTVTGYVIPGPHFGDVGKTTAPFWKGGDVSLRVLFSFSLPEAT